MAAGPFSRHLARVGVGAGAGLYQAGRRILKRSDQLIPIDTGTARSSGRVMLPEVHGDEIRVVVGYGYGNRRNPKTGESAIGYVIPLHERVEVRHGNGRQAKFLEKAALEEIPTLAADVAVSIMRADKTDAGIVYSLETLGGE